MNLLCSCSAALVVLAQDDTFEALGRGLRDGPSGRSLLMFGVAAAMLIAVFIVITRYSSRKPRSAVDDEVDVRAKLLDLLELGPAEREDLDFVTANLGEAFAPAAVLLSPRNFALGVQQAGPGASDDARRSRLNELCLKLFDEPIPDCAAGPAATDT